MKLKALLVAGAVAGGLFASAAPAAAYCDQLIYELTGRCDNGCTLTARTYHTLDDRARDLLPDVEFICPM